MPAPSWTIPTVFEVYSIGDAEVLASAFNGLAMITASDSFGSMLRMAFLIGILGFAAKVVFTGKFDAIPLLASILMYFVMFAPRATVVVVDAFSAAAYPVANVPIGIAAPFSIVSRTGKYFAETFETAFAVVSDDARFMGAGYLDALTVLLQLRDVEAGTANTNGTATVDIQKSIVNYLVDCVHYDIGRSDSLFPPIVTSDRIRNEPNTWDALRTDFVNIYTRQFLAADGPSGTDRSCSYAYEQLTPLMTAGGAWQSTAFEGWLKKVLQKGGATALPPGVTATAKIEGAVNAIGIAGGSGAQFAINSFLATMIRMSDNKMQISSGTVQSAIIQSQAENARNVQWTGERTMFEKVARPVTAFIEIFLVAATPLMAFAIAAFGMAGVQTLVKFLLLHFWVSLWTPTLAIANLYCITRVNRYVEYITSASETVNPISPLSLYGLDNITQKLQTEFATGSMLAAATPMLTLLLIYGSSQVASLLAGKMSSASEIDAKVAAPSVMAPAPVTQMTPTISGNSTLGMSTHGGLIANLNAGTTQTQTVGMLQSAQSSANVRAATELSRVYGTGDARNKNITWSEESGYRAEGGSSTEFTSVLNSAQKLAAAHGQNSAVGLKLAREALKSTTAEGGISGKFDTKNVPVIGKALKMVGLSAEVGGSWKTADVDKAASALSVDKTTARSILQELSDSSTSGKGEGASLRKAANHIKSSRVADGTSKTANKMDTEGFTRATEESASISKALTQQRALSDIINVHGSGTPKQFLGALDTMYESQGKSTGAELQAMFRTSYGGDQSLQQAALNRQMANPAVKNDFRGSPERLREGAMIMAMASDPRAQALAALFAPLMSNPNFGMGMSPSAATAVKQSGMATPGTPEGQLTAGVVAATGAIPTGTGALVAANTAGAGQTVASADRQLEHAGQKAAVVEQQARTDPSGAAFAAGIPGVVAATESGTNTVNGQTAQAKRDHDVATRGDDGIFRRVTPEAQESQVNDRVLVDTAIKIP